VSSRPGGPLQSEARWGRVAQWESARLTRDRNVGRVAQWESVRFTRGRSLVRNQPRPWLDGSVAADYGGAQFDALRLSLGALALAALLFTRRLPTESLAADDV
jgi:hypothetical protein